MLTETRFEEINELYAWWTEGRSALAHAYLSIVMPEQLYKDMSHSQGTPFTVAELAEWLRIRRGES
jgi:hypothetical protein